MNVGLLDLFAKILQFLAINPWERVVEFMSIDKKVVGRYKTDGEVPRESASGGMEAKIS